MMIVMKEGATEEQVAAVVKRVEEVGAHADVSTGELVTVIGAIGDREHVANLGLEGAPGVDHLVPILKPYKLASAQYKRGDRTVVEVDGRKIGGDHFATIAGPCTVESREVLLDTARTVTGARRAARVAMSSDLSTSRVLATISLIRSNAVRFGGTVYVAGYR